ncbi:hypothetical protein JCM10207_001985 [Rhodosporidiobolus poonsookiae]
MGGCPIFVQIINEVVLLFLIACMAIPMWPTIKAFSFSGDWLAMSQPAGVVSSATAALCFLLCFCAGSVAGIFATVFAVLDVAAYAFWSYNGIEGIIWRVFPDNAKSTATDLSLPSAVSDVIQCDASWMKWGVWLLLSVSGSLQLSVAMSAACGGGGMFGSDSLGKRRAAPAGQTAATSARSLGKRRRAVFGASAREEKRGASDEEAELRGLGQREETESSEEEYSEEKRRPRRSGETSSSESSSTDEDVPPPGWDAPVRPRSASGRRARGA